MSPCQSFKLLSQLIAWVLIPSSPLKNPTQRGKALQLWERMCYRWKTNSSFFSTYKLLIFNLHSPG